MSIIIKKHILPLSIFVLLLVFVFLPKIIVLAQFPTFELYCNIDTDPDQCIGKNVTPYPLVTQPRSPVSADKTHVTITAHAQDVSGILPFGSVMAYIEDPRLGHSGQYINLEYSSAVSGIQNNGSMHDDGYFPDVTANDGIYSLLVDVSNTSIWDPNLPYIVDISATDNLGNESLMESDNIDYGQATSFIISGANPTTLSVLASSPVISGGATHLSATLTYTNNSMPIVGATVNFTDTTNSSDIGPAITDDSGVARISYSIPFDYSGPTTVDIRASYAGASGIGGSNGTASFVINACGDSETSGQITLCASVSASDPNTISSFTINGSTNLSVENPQSVTFSVALSSALAGQTITFTDESSNNIIGTATTNSSGVATRAYFATADETIGAFYQGSSAPYLAPSHKSASVTITGTGGSGSCQSSGAINLCASVSASNALSLWGYKKQITISNDNVDSNLNNFPLLVELNGDVNVGAHAKSDGTDIIFTDDGGNLLNFERENYSVVGNAASGDFWVKVPTISHSSATTIYLYYGNATAVDMQNKTAVWDANFKGVWHVPNGSTLSANDSTSNANTGTIGGAAAATPGKIDGAAIFDGSTNAVIYDNSPTSFPSGSVATASAWIYPTSYSDATFNGVVSWGGRYYCGQSFVAAIQNTGRLSLATWCFDFTPTSGASATLNTWNYATWVLNGVSVNLYLNGSLMSSGTLSGMPDIFPYYLSIGSTDFFGRYFNGKIDEVRVSNSVRPPEWIKFEYYNASSSDNELTIGAQQAL